jgi:nucleoid-associated protein YgaU
VVLASAMATECGGSSSPANNLVAYFAGRLWPRVRFTLIYEANRAQIRDPNLIFPGQVFSLPTPAASSLSR